MSKKGVGLIQQGVGMIKQGVGLIKKGVRTSTVSEITATKISKFSLRLSIWLCWVSHLLVIPGIPETLCTKYCRDRWWPFCFSQAHVDNVYVLPKINACAPRSVQQFRIEILSDGSSIWAEPYSCLSALVCRYHQPSFIIGTLYHSNLLSVT